MTIEGLIAAEFKGGSMDGKKRILGKLETIEVQIMRYIGPDKKEDGTWPEGSDDMYVPAEVEVYTPTEQLSPRTYIFQLVRTY